jgi:hypothetical protein
LAKLYFPEFSLSLDKGENLTIFNNSCSQCENFLLKHNIIEMNYNELMIKGLRQACWLSILKHCILNSMTFRDNMSFLCIDTWIKKAKKEAENKLLK